MKLKEVREKLENLEYNYTDNGLYSLVIKEFLEGLYYQYEHNVYENVGEVEVDVEKLRDDIQHYFKYDYFITKNQAIGYVFRYWNTIGEALDACEYSMAEYVDLDSKTEDFLCDIFHIALNSLVEIVATNVMYLPCNKVEIPQEEDELDDIPF